MNTLIIFFKRNHKYIINDFYIVSIILKKFILNSESHINSLFKNKKQSICLINCGKTSVSKKFFFHLNFSFTPNPWKINKDNFISIIFIDCF